MEFDIYSLGIGIVLGLALAFIFRLHVLKRLDLKIDKIGVGLGVEGFEEKEKPPGVSIGDVSGEISGDIAGRDINKNSNFYQTIEAATRDAVAKTMGRPDFDAPLLQISYRFESRTNEPSLQAELKNIDTRDKKWFEKYIETYCNSSQFSSDIADEMSRLRNDGWNLNNVRAVDNIINGMLFEITASKSL